MLAGDALGNKGGAPDDRHHEEQQIGFETHIWDKIQIEPAQS